MTTDCLFFFSVYKLCVNDTEYEIKADMLEVKRVTKMVHGKQQHR